eukprot:m.1333457 g.1333457  ORF g.1333457 m.1333457 type:complete len:249 (-) comp24871_c0_seq3:5212-5958(-)
MVAQDEAPDPDAYVSQWLSQQVDRKGIKYGESKSEYFGPQYKLVMTRKEIDLAVDRVAEFLNTNFVGEKIVLCGILKGAFIFITDLCRKLTRPYSIYFVEASSYTGQKQSGKVELLSQIVPSKFEGRRVVLIDELLDNGHTMHTMVHHLMDVLSIPRTQITTCVLFTKKVAARPAEYKADFTGVDELPSVWLVGYGLDDQGTKRGWTELLGVPKAPGVPGTEDDVIFDGSDAGRAHLKTIRAAVLAQL